MMFGDNQLSLIAKDYYHDKSFCREKNGEIDLWKVFNLFTGANKQSYIDTFLDRGQNAHNFISHIKNSVKFGADSWFLR